MTKDVKIYHSKLINISDALLITYHKSFSQREEDNSMTPSHDIKGICCYTELVPKSIFCGYFFNLTVKPLSGKIFRNTECGLQRPKQSQCQKHPASICLPNKLINMACMGVRVTK